MPKTLSGKQVVKILCREYGFCFVSQRGSHVKLKNRAKSAITIIPIHRELAPGTLRGILKLAKVDEKDFRKNI
ncbi:MAG: hypothetical protein UT22_C0046G0002 [Parcubacteria group bacterium GW2011_GWC2_39_11]|nr:MAG: hypothetical protein UT22_C0046G0002 [Parcubacteria group bacterium GW2011_GWC2_39_11]